MTECNGCGGCCNPVVMPFGPMDLIRLSLVEVARIGTADDVENIVFARQHFHPMTRREGLGRAPYLTNGGKTTFSFDARGLPEVAFSYFYDCDRFDPETRQCTDYDDRPPLCRDYPWYGSDLDNQWNKAKALPETCSFRADIGLPVTPVPVELGPTRR